MSILGIHITVSEYIVINLHCSICNPQNQITGDWCLVWQILMTCGLFMACIFSFHQLKTLAMTHSNQGATALPLPLSHPLAWWPQCWVSLSTFWSQASQQLSCHGNGEKSRCSTWGGCTQPPLQPLQGEEIETNPLWSHSLQEYFSLLKGNKGRNRQFIALWLWQEHWRTMKMARHMHGCMLQANCFLTGKHSKRPKTMEARPAIMCLVCSSL